MKISSYEIPMPLLESQQPLTKRCGFQIKPPIIVCWFCKWYLKISLSGMYSNVKTSLNGSRQISLHLSDKRLQTLIEQVQKSRFSHFSPKATFFTLYLGLTWKSPHFYTSILQVIHIQSVTTCNKKFTLFHVDHVYPCKMKLLLSLLLTNMLIILTISLSSISDKKKMACQEAG